MKVEKLSDTKLKIILTIDELKKRNISVVDLKNNATKSKEVFSNLLNEIELNDFFIADDSELLVEAMTDNDSLFVIVVTKLQDMPDISSYNLLNSDSIQNKVEFHIFKFDSILNLKDFINSIKNTNSTLPVPMFWGKNSIYLLNNSFYISFSKYSIKNSNFLNSYNFLTEYTDNMYDSKIMDTSLNEKGTLLIKDKAVQTLISL